MAQAMTPAMKSAFAQAVAGRPVYEAKNGYEFRYQLVSAAGGLAVTAQRDDDRAEGVIEWVLGAGAQGQTPLIRVGNALLESRVSYFPPLGRFGITIGQAAESSRSAAAALGVKQSSRDAKACLGCHSAGVTSELGSVIPGVQCEQCHARAEEHARGLASVVNPGKLDAMDQVRICGACHRLTPPVDDTQIENVRFQPARLMRSRCFVSGRLACTTCHPAHEDAKRNDAVFYNGKCGDCHETVHAEDVRRKGDCIGCHMPYVQLHPALKFTDHYIRVVKAGDYPVELLRRRGGGG
jgi:hypothetical protein